MAANTPVLVAGQPLLAISGSVRALPATTAFPPTAEFESGKVRFRAVSSA